MAKRPKKLASVGLHLFRQYRAGLLISFMVCLISVSLYVGTYFAVKPPAILSFLHDLELKTLDLRFKLRGRVQPDPAVVIVAIDQKSEDRLGRWPFPRQFFAEAVDALRADGARVVAFDVNFPQPDQNSALQALQELSRAYKETVQPGGANQAFEAKMKALAANADNDAMFAGALSHFDNVILGYFFLPSNEARSQNQKLVQDFLNYLSFQSYPRIDHLDYAKQLASQDMLEVREGQAISPNLPQFAVNAKNFGYFNVIPDKDGTVRREPVVMKFQDSFYPSLDIASVLAYTNLPLDQVKVVFNRNGLERIELGKITLPTDPGGFVHIDFYGPDRGPDDRTFPIFSLADVIGHNLPAGTFKDKLVLIGPMATGIPDTAVTPFQEMAFYGVEVHANFISDLLHGRFIRRGLRENLIDLGVILVFSLGAGILLSVVPASRATGIVLLGLGLFFAVAYHLFARSQIWIAVFLPTATLMVNYGGIISYRFFFEEREKRKVRSAFHQYVPPGLITQILERPELLRLGGEEKEITAMFSDIRGFTTLSEGLSPTTLVDLLNEYLSAMTDVLFRWWGTLDKYIGDAIMAFWGAPYPQPDHALRACQAALEMLRTLEELQARWEAQGRPRIDIGIGINTGPMVVGNMGSSRRFNFTIMGDNVNLASRLEGINKQFGTRLIISESTYLAVRDQLIARELDLIRVKGKTRPVKIYELLGPLSESEQYRDLTERFHRGLEAYRRSRWEEALEIFDEITLDSPQDAPTHVFIKRCHDFLASPPDGVWDGVYVMKTK